MMFTTFTIFAVATRNVYEQIFIYFKADWFTLDLFTLISCWFNNLLMTRRNIFLNYILHLQFWHLWFIVSLSIKAWSLFILQRLFYSEWTDLNLQDRDKGAARIHLGDTIEELKKFNARRKLKDAVKAAISSSKWHAPYSEANGDNFSDVGDDEITTGISNASDFKISFLWYVQILQNAIQINVFLSTDV